jgi:putative phage-type endonuclease
VNIIQAPYELDDPRYRPWWLAWRRFAPNCGMGSSDAAILAGVAPATWGSPLTMHFDKRGMIQAKEETEEQSSGLMLEDDIAEMYAKKYGVEWQHKQCLVVNPRLPWMRASLDLVTTTREVVDTKSVGDPMLAIRLRDGEIDTLPDYWHTQGQWQIEAAELERMWFGVFSCNRVMRFEIVRNQEMIDALIVLASEFRDGVLSEEPPDDIRPGDADMLRYVFGANDRFVELGSIEADAATEYERAGEEIKRLEAIKETAKARLLLSMEDATAGSFADGRTIKRSVSQIAERTQTVKAHRQTRIYIKKSRSA